MQISLSVSKKEVYTKKEGEKVVNFKKVALDTSKTEDYNRLRELVQTNLQSTNVWENDHCSNNTFEYCTGYMLDIDKKLSIDDAMARLSKLNWNYIFYTTTNHGKDRLEKYRVILPIDPERYESQNFKTHQANIAHLTEIFPELDHSATEPARKFFPSTGENKLLFDFQVYSEGKFYEPVPVSFNLKALDLQEHNHPIFELDTIIMKSDHTECMVRDITTKTRIFCPFCDHSTRGNPELDNAFIMLNKNKVHFISCESCKDAERGVGKVGIYNLKSVQAYETQVKHEGTSVFRDTKTDTFYIGRVYEKEEGYQFRAIAKNNIKGSFDNLDLFMPNPTPELTYKFDFTQNELVDHKKGVANKYAAPEVLKKEIPTTKTYTLPNYTGKVIDHLCGHNTEVATSLIHHLAYILQERAKTRVAFMFHGTQRTGKGLFINYILRQVVGKDNVYETKQQAIIDQFNGFLESNIFILINELHSNFTQDAEDKMSSALKQIISDEGVSIRKMYNDGRNGANVANIFLATNKRGALKIEKDDSRVIVGDWQPVKIFDTAWWPKSLAGDTMLPEKKMEKLLDSELEEFVFFLRTFKYDPIIINQVIHNDAREALIDVSEDLEERFFEALLEGDSDWFAERVSKPVYNGLTFGSPNEAFKEAISNKKVLREHLALIYEDIIGVTTTPAGYSRVSNLHGVPVKNIRFADGTVKKGSTIEWSTL